MGNLKLVMIKSLYFWANYGGEEGLSFLLIKKEKGKFFKLFCTD